ncbi:MAG: tRNA (guanosine(37)-N1)-methyltransferase TrmD [Patescibacteria group bacterium]
MTFDIITIFPKIFDSYFKESIIKRASEKKLIKVNVHNLRDFTSDKHRKVDDKPYGGGPGMVFKIEPLARALNFILKNGKKGKTAVVLFSPAGKQFNGKIAGKFAGNYNRLILICGRYEGIDERVKKVVSDFGFKIMELSIGPYVLTGGELPAMVLVDAVSRQIKGVLGKEESLEEKRNGVGAPVYTRPEVFEHKGKKYRVPKVLLSGAHKKIEEWRRELTRTHKTTY